MSLDDRLSFGGGPLGGLPPEDQPEEEAVEPQEGKSNKAFIFIAIAMGGLILLGVLALIGSLVFIVPKRKQASLAAVTETIAAATLEAQAWTPTPQPTATTVAQLPTWTPTMLPTTAPEPTATNTRVVQDQGSTAGTAKATATRPASTEWGSSTPQTGLGGLGIASIAVGLTGIIFAARKLRK